jgi:hypothetical protein
MPRSTSRCDGGGCDARVIELLIPGVLGIAAFVLLSPLVKRVEAIKLCKPGGTLEIVVLGPATIEWSLAKSIASTRRAPAVYGSRPALASKRYP